MPRDIIYVVMIFLLLLSLVLVIVFTQHEKKDHIHESECSKPKGEYAVDPGFQTTDIVKLCGDDGKSPCVFSVDNLKSAIDVCNRNPDKCFRFMYDNRRNSITFINNTTDLTSNITTDIFTRQT
jgi:hypothetical protein